MYSGCQPSSDNSNKIKSEAIIIKLIPFINSKLLLSIVIKYLDLIEELNSIISMIWS